MPWEQLRPASLDLLATTDCTFKCELKWLFPSFSCLHWGTSSQQRKRTGRVCLHSESNGAGCNGSQLLECPGIKSVIAKAVATSVAMWLAVQLSSCHKTKALMDVWAGNKGNQNSNTTKSQRSHDYLIWKAKLRKAAAKDTAFLYPPLLIWLGASLLLMLILFHI